ncbi:MAG: sulfate adenylyltransferase subunit CysN [Acidimicrobiales bacterium]
MEKSAHLLSTRSELLRFATAGSVDDGKSTLIGRLLYDSKQVFEDQLEAVEATSLARGDEYTNLALLTDGLRAEREQGITIDVAYRYFATPKRKFIIADTPGHTQHTRNMVTGCSTADLVILLVDARAGATEQTRRHATVASLLGIRHLVLCINKMDLVDWDRKRFEEIRRQFDDFSARLQVTDLTYIPISALRGDNVVDRSTEMKWYDGPSLLHHLEEVHISSDRNLIDFRFPVQRVVRPISSSDLHDFRGYAGQVASGVLEVGDEVIVLPSGFTSTVEAIETADGPVSEAYPPMAVVVRLTDELDISRGDMLCRPHNQPRVGQDLSAMVCWMAESPLKAGAKLTIKHTTRWARALVKDLQYRLDVNTLHRDQEAAELVLNDIGRINIRTTVPLFYDEYRSNRSTGSFILVDESTNNTVGAGMILRQST